MEVVSCTIYILESRAESTQKSNIFFQKHSGGSKKKSSEGFQNITYPISFITYKFVCLTEKSVLLKTDTFKKYSVNNKQSKNAFVYWP